MAGYNDVFGGASIYPADITYTALNLTANVTLSWPLETTNSDNLATSVVDIETTSTSGLSVIMPDATQAATGQTVLFNNLSAHSVYIKDSGGVTIATVGTGTIWQVYLYDNTTTAGGWRALQYGAAVSIADANALAGNGLVAVGTTLAQSVPNTSFNSNYTAGASDRATMFIWTGAAGVFTLPDPVTVGSNWFCYLRNAGSGAIVATPPSGSVYIDSMSSLSFQPGESAIIVTNGTNFYTVGFGQSATFAFDYTAINVAGTGNYTLSGTELNRVSYKFTGALTGNRTIIVPTTVQQYWITNGTTGAYTFTVKTAAGTGVTVPQGAAGIYYCDGTNVVNADTASLAVPLTIAQGGTNSTTAGGALINLGGTTTGIAVFTAASTSDAQIALGAGATGQSIFTAATASPVWTALGVAPLGTVNGGTF